MIRIQTESFFNKNKIIFSATLEPTNYDNMGPKKKGRGKNRKKAATPEPESSEDDLIVVKTEYNTVDPITKKEIGMLYTSFGG